MASNNKNLFDGFCESEIWFNLWKECSHNVSKSWRLIWRLSWGRICSQAHPCGCWPGVGWDSLPPGLLRGLPVCCMAQRSSPRPGVQRRERERVSTIDNVIIYSRSLQLTGLYQTDHRDQPGTMQEGVPRMGRPRGRHHWHYPGSWLYKCCKEVEWVFYVGDCFSSLGLTLERAEVTQQR